MRVLHVITGLGAGGAERQLVDLVRHSRHEHSVAALSNVGAVGEELRAAGVPVFDARMRSNRDVAAVPRLVLHMARERPDVVHAHLYRACVYGRVAAALARVPAVVTTEHSLGEALIEGRRVTPAVRRLYLATDHFSQRTFAVSSAVRDRLVALGVDAGKVDVLPNGIDLPRYRFDPSNRREARRELGLAADERVIGTVGRLVPTKGHARTLRAAQPLLANGTARMIIVGDGPARPSLVDLAGRLGVAGRVCFLGERADVSRLLAAMDVYVSASDVGEETFGIAAVEALASGLPVVYTYCPALVGVRSPRLHWCPDGAGLAEALRAAVASGTGPRDPGPVVEAFAIEGVARQLDAAYDALHRSRRPCVR